MSICLSAELSPPATHFMAPYFYASAHVIQARLSTISLCAVIISDLANKPGVCNQPWALCPAELSLCCL